LAEFRDLFRGREGPGPPVQIDFHPFKPVNLGLVAIEELDDLTAPVADLVTAPKQQENPEKDAEADQGSFHRSIKGLSILADFWGRTVGSGGLLLRKIDGVDDDGDAIVAEAGELRISAFRHCFTYYCSYYQFRSLGDQSPDCHQKNPSLPSFFGLMQSSVTSEAGSGKPVGMPGAVTGHDSERSEVNHGPGCLYIKEGNSSEFPPSPLT